MEIDLEAKDSSANYLDLRSDESGDDSGSEIPRGVVKKRKFTGAFQYKTSFKDEWKKTWPFILPVPGLPYFFRCQVCDKNLSCGHQGVSDVKDHIATQKHQLLANSLSTQGKLPFAPVDPLQDKVVYGCMMCDRLLIMMDFITLSTLAFMIIVLYVFTDYSS